MDLTLFVAEFIGTFILISSILITGNPLYIAAAFLAAITIIGGISGGHINPAVSLVMFVNGTITMNKLLNYIPAQILGALSAYYLYKNINKSSS